jgi:tetratricopeptide (TPR) repeat protein
MDPTANTDALERFRRLQSLCQLDPGNTQLGRACVEAALQAHAYDFVLERAEKQLAVQPADVAALFDKASSLIGLREYRDAAAALQNVLALQPQIVAANINLGLCRYCLGEFSEGRAPLDAAYAAGDRSAGLLRLLVSTYHHVSLLDEALAICQANPQPALSDPALAGTYALVYLDSDDADGASEWAGRALASNPRNVDALVADGTVGVLRMETSRAEREFELALEIAPNTARAWIGLGTLALLSNDLPRARHQLARGVELMPGHVGSWQMLGWAHLLANDLDAAESTLQHALVLDRNFAENHGAITAVAALRGKPDEAEHEIEIALRLDPQCLSAQFARSVLMSRAGNPEEGQRLVRVTANRFAAGNKSALSRAIGRVSGRPPRTH